MNFSPEVIIVLEERFRAVGVAMLMSSAAVGDAYHAIIAMQEMDERRRQAEALEKAAREQELAELQEMIAAIKEEKLRQACDAENGDAARYGKVGQRYIGNDASDCRSVRSVEQKPSSYG